MPTSSLATLKKDFGFNDSIPVEYEEKDGELIIRLCCVSKYSGNDEIINQAYKLAEQRKSDGWTREDFFDDFLRIRDEVLGKIRAYYGDR